MTQPCLRTICQQFRAPLTEDHSPVVRFQLLAYSSSDHRLTPVRYATAKLDVNGDFYSATQEAPQRSDTTYVLHLFGRTQLGHSVAIHVQYCPSLMVCLPDHWTAMEVSSLMDHFNQQRRIPASCLSTEIVHYHRLAGFYPDLASSTPQLRKFPFLRITCRSQAYLQVVKNFFRYSTVTVADLVEHAFLLIEQDIPPVLNLLNTCHGRPSAGIEIDKAQLRPLVNMRLTHCDLEFDCKVTNDSCPLRGIELDEVYPLVLLAFDIECVPGDGRSFPTAEKADDVVITICSVAKNMKTGVVCRASHMLRKHTLLDGEVHQFMYDSEQELIEEWRDFVIAVDPDIITGYNSHRFDWPYLATRMQGHDVNSRFFFLSRLIQHCSVMEEKEFSSKAYGSSTTNKFDIPGRIDVDLCTYVMRNYKLKSYKLDNVAQHFIGQGKSGLSIKEMIAHFLSNEPDQLREIVRYCLQDAELPILIWDNQRILSSLIGMSQVTYVFLNDLFSRGQMFKVVSQLFVNGRERGFALTHLPKINFADTYKGATVLDIKSGFYRLLVVLDFASLYPSIMKAKNLCYTSLVTDEKNSHVPGYEYYQTKTDLGEFRFQQTLRGLLPAVIDSLLTKRTEAKLLMKQAQTAGNGALVDIYNARQLALKVSCNSIYGFTGAQQSDYWCPQIASAVTAYGRHLIGRTKEIIETEFCRFGADVVYGDTDSVMVNFPEIADTPGGFLQAFEIGEAAAALISRSFEPDISLQFEKAFCPGIMMSKKHYVARAFESASSKGKIDAKGIALVRRDFCTFQQQMYAKVLDVLLFDSNTEKAVDSALQAIGQCLQQLIDGQVDFQSLVLSRQLAKEYKSEHIMQKVVADKMEQRTPGSGPRSGERVDFVVVPGKTDNAPMYEKVEDAQYAMEHKVPLDLVYYIESFMPSMKALFEPFSMDQRLRSFFAQYTAQAYRITHNNASMLDFYTPVTATAAATAPKASLFASTRLAPPKGPTKRKQLSAPVTTANKSSLFSK